MYLCTQLLRKQEVYISELIWRILSSIKVNLIVDYRYELQQLLKNYIDRDNTLLITYITILFHSLKIMHLNGHIFLKYDCRFWRRSIGNDCWLSKRLMKANLNPSIHQKVIYISPYGYQRNFDLIKIPVKFFKAYSYLPGVTAAKRRRHLSIINVIFNG